jgi:hypothetical protein
MDQNFLRNIGYFSVPNNQTLNPVDQSGDASGLSSQLQSPIWEEPSLTSTGFGQTRDPSSGAPSLSLDSLAPSTAASLNNYSPAMSSPSVFGQNPRPIISPRLQRARDGHERKRSRLNTESTPFDSVDYWIQFDQDQQLQQQQRQQQQLLLQQQQQQIQQLQQQQQQQQQQMQRQRQLQLKQQQQKQLQQKAKAQQQSAEAEASLEQELTFEDETTGTAPSSQMREPTKQ